MVNKFDIENDKRHFFRVDDLSLVKHRVIDADGSQEKNVHAYEQRKKRLTLKAKFESMSREMRPIHKMIAANNSKVAQYLAMIEKKLDMLSDSLVRSEIEEMKESTPQEVNIGAGGVSFMSSSPVMVGGVLEMELVLLPEHNVIFSLAKVVSCVKVEPGTAEKNNYRIAVQFYDMDEGVRDIVSRHVIKKEIEAVVLSSGEAQATAVGKK